MNARRSVAGTLSLLSVLALSSSALAAPAKASMISQHKLMGHYNVVLKIGPAMMMSVKPSKTGETTMGGQMATCKMSGMPSKKHKMCNHHVEVHVYRSSNGKVITNARVTITLTNMVKNTKISVPIMKMHGPTGIKDFHYGNNLYAAAGRYDVTVLVNGIKGIFPVNLK